jgi:hypothetical protein
MLPIPSVYNNPLGLFKSGMVSVLTPSTSTVTAILDKFWPTLAAFNAGFD